MGLDPLHLECRLDLMTQFLGQEYGNEKKKSNFTEEKPADTTSTSNN